MNAMMTIHGLAVPRSVTLAALYHRRAETFVIAPSTPALQPPPPGAVTLGVTEAGSSAPTLAEARRHGRRTLLVGLAVVALTLGGVAIAAAMEAKSTMVSGTAFILGWIITGFGLAESVMGNRLGLVRMLIALLVGIAGVVFNFWAMHAMGFELRR